MLGEFIHALAPAIGGMLDKVIDVGLLIRFLVFARHVERLGLLRQGGVATSIATEVSLRIVLLVSVDIFQRVTRLVKRTLYLLIRTPTF